MSRFFAALLAVCIAGAQAQVFKCVDGTGRVSFADQPCAPTQKASEVRIHAGPPAQAPASAPRMSAEAQAYERERQRRRDQSDESHRRIDEAAAKVRKIRAENYDPGKCAAAKAKMAAMEQRDPIAHKLDVSYFEYQQAASLYCGN